MTVPTTHAGWRKLFDDTLPSERIERAIDCLLQVQAGGRALGDWRCECGADVTLCVPHGFIAVMPGQLWGPENDGRCPRCAAPPPAQPNSAALDAAPTPVRDPIAWPDMPPLPRPAPEPQSVGSTHIPWNEPGKHQPPTTPIREEMTDELIDEHTHAMFEDAPPMETIDEMRAIARHFYALGQGKS